MVRQTMTTRIPACPRRPAMTGRLGRRTTDNGRRTTDKRKGFTLVELMIVVVVLAILVALLLPVINGALRTARNAQVSAEINNLAQALEQFKSKYGDYPPSRIILTEDGNYSTLLGSNQSVKVYDPTSPGGSNDITVGQLAARTVSAFRKFWPRVQLNTSPGLTYVFPQTSKVWYDFNGNGQFDYEKPYVLRGHECLAFFLGGIPLYDSGTGGYSMTGFGNNPQNPFSNMVNNGNGMYNTNRQQPIYEFNPGRLFPDPANLYIPNTQQQVLLNVPGYYDTLNSGPPLANSGLINFFVYFSAYGNGNYDPNDVNFHESDGDGNTPISLSYYVSFPLHGSSAAVNVATSWSPNPYTSTLTKPLTNTTITYQKPQSYQIISAGTDGVYGLGGQYVQQTQSSTVTLPFDTNNTVPSADVAIRQREYDNVTNFKSGTLQ